MRDFQLPGRSAAYAVNGMAATSHPLGTATALDVMRSGGNAVDAAIAAVAVLCVVEPQATGIGGDCFALFAPKGGGEVIGYNGSGRAPAAASVAWFQERGIEAIGASSVHAVTVPGAIEAWTRLAADHGSWDLARILAPAIRYAEEGYPITPRVASDWRSEAPRLARQPSSAAVFLPGGQVPAVGTIHRQPALGATLRTIAERGRAGFYEGPQAAAMVAHLRGLGGLHTEADFAEALGDYVTPIRTAYRDVEILAIPPNNQGIVAHQILNILEGFDLAALDPLGAERFHLEMEAARLAFRDRNALMADASAMTAEVSDLLSKDYAAALRRLIRRDAAMTDLPPPGVATGDTTYLTVVDRDRNAVSLINSIYHSFGSAITCPRTGVLFQNRGYHFRLDPAHPNVIAGRKRTLHTIMPGMVVRGGRAWLAFGVMGGDYQPVGQAHVLTNMLDYGMDVQQAIDCPRCFLAPVGLKAERGLATATIHGLMERGHAMAIASEALGGGQGVMIDHEHGVLVGGSDPRKDGVALGW
jgi:gamma-glutamyltranspeptidase/glutathione hydrolase